MRKRIVLWACAAIVALPVLGVAGWIATLPSPKARMAPPPIAEAEHQAMLAALKPPKRERPVVAIIGINNATETNDYLMPYGILRRADVAEVMTLATGPGPVTLFPALTVEPQATIAEFDRQYREGADYVVVPAMSRDDDPAALGWIRKQAERGAIIVSVCAGAKVVAAAGLLDGRRATTHWYYLDEMREKWPGFDYVADRRMVVDRGVVTTTGITASMPMMLTLVEAIAGREKAESVARDLGVDGWDARHDSGAFTMTRSFAMAALGNLLPFWRHEKVGLPIAPGVDEVSLALAADAWSRTYRSRALTLAPAAVESRGGIRIVPDRAPAEGEGFFQPVSGDLLPPASALDDALGKIARRYGAGTRDFVAMQLEYPRKDSQ